MKKKNSIFIIIGILIIAIAFGSTLAYFIWTSTEEEKDISLSVDSVNTNDSMCKKISDNNPKLLPVSTRDKGRIVKINAKQTLSEYAYITWTLTINSINTQDTETDGLKHQTFKYELVNETTNTPYGTGNFAGVEEGDTITFSNNTENLAYNKNYIFVLYLWIDGTIGRNPLDMMDQTYSFDLVCDITGEGNSKVQNRASTAAEYITNLYTNAPKTVATNNETDYNLAPSVNLMNDRLGGTTKDLDSGDIRYYGANPDNYVWLGDTYTSDYTFTSNGETVTRQTGDKKLWRVIGVFDNQLKLILNDPIYPSGLSWDTSANITGGNSGNGINEWSEADLMKLLNPGYESNQDLDSEGNTITINNSLYWTKGTGTVYTGQSNAVTTNVSFANTGLSSTEKNMIDTATWYLGAYDGSASYINVQYAAERQGTVLGKICSSSVNCNDTVTRTATWEGKVGLMYPSDYGYAVDLSECQNKKIGYTSYPIDGTGYSDSTCQNDWLKSSTLGQWTISPRAVLSNASAISCITSGNFVDGNNAYSISYRVRPVVYLKSDVTISGGDGKEATPYVLSLS